MGCDYSVYLGPYIQFKTQKKPTILEKYDKFACTNVQCPQHDKALTSDVKFCVRCGTKITPQIEEVEEDQWIVDFAEEMEINDEVYPDQSDESNGDTQIWFPIIENNRDCSWDVKYDEVWEDLTDLDIKAEIKRVKKECAKALKVLEKFYGMKAEIRWGLISSIT